MDIEEYLRQKRELEAKKEMLEAKEKVVDHDKERFKKEQRAKLYAEHGVTPKHPTPEYSERAPSHHYQMPSSGPGMWNTILLFLILILLAVSYFVPRFGEDQIRNIIKEESGDEQIDAEQDQNDGEQQDDAIQDDNNNGGNEEPIEEPQEGPLFTLSVSDNGLDKSSTRDDEVFDKYGTLDGDILRIDNARRGYYDDFVVKIANEEDEWIVCELDRDVEIDKDFDGETDLESHDIKRYKLKIKSTLYDLVDEDVVPGTIDSREGIYEGRGSVLTTYEAHCSFCEDDSCIKEDNSRGKRTEKTFFKVYINEDESGLGTNLTTNRTR